MAILETVLVTFIALTFVSAVFGFVFLSWEVIRHRPRRRV
jgi:hypothetical protein